MSGVKEGTASRKVTPYNEKNQPLPPTGLSLVRFILQSAAAQPSEFINHGCTRIGPDKAGESASPLMGESLAAPIGLVSVSSRLHLWFNCRF